MNKCRRLYNLLPKDTRKKFQMRRDGFIIDNGFVFRPTICEANEHGIIFAGKTPDRRLVAIYIFIPRQVGRIIAFSLKKYILEVPVLKAIIHKQQYNINKDVLNEMINKVPNIEKIDESNIKVRALNKEFNTFVIFADEIDDIYGITSVDYDENAVVEVLSDKKFKEYKINVGKFPIPFKELESLTN